MRFDKSPAYGRPVKGAMLEKRKGRKKEGVPIYPNTRSKCLYAVFLIIITLPRVISKTEKGRRTGETSIYVVVILSRAI